MACLVNIQLLQCCHLTRKQMKKGSHSRAVRFSNQECPSMAQAYAMGLLQRTPQIPK